MKPPWTKPVAAIVAWFFSMGQAIPLAYAQEMLRTPAVDRSMAAEQRIQDRLLEGLSAAERAQQLPHRPQQVDWTIPLGQFFVSGTIPQPVFEALQRHLDLEATKLKLQQASVKRVVDGAHVQLEAHYHAHLPSPALARDLISKVILPALTPPAPTDDEVGAPVLIDDPVVTLETISQAMRGLRPNQLIALTEAVVARHTVASLRERARRHALFEMKTPLPGTALAFQRHVGPGATEAAAPSAEVRPEVFQQFPEAVKVLGTPTVNGHELNVLSVIADVTRAFRGEGARVSNARRQRLHQEQPTRTFGDPNTPSYPDVEGNTLTRAQIRKGMLDHAFGVPSPESWHLKQPGPRVTEPGLQGTGNHDDMGMIMGELGSGMASYMWDEEDARSGRRRQIWQGRVNRKEVFAGEWRDRVFHHDLKNKDYRITAPPSEWPEPFLRVPGLELEDESLLVDGVPAPAMISSFAIDLLNNYDSLVANGFGANFYIPKVETPEEAILLANIIDRFEKTLGVPRGTITIEILNEREGHTRNQEIINWILRFWLVGGSFGRWDYGASLQELNRTVGVYPDMYTFDMWSKPMHRGAVRNAMLNSLVDGFPIGGMAAFMKNNIKPDDPPEVKAEKERNNARVIRLMRLDKVRERLQGRYELIDQDGNTIKRKDGPRQSWVATTEPEYVKAGTEPLVEPLEQFQAFLDVNLTDAERSRLESEPLGLLKDGQITTPRYTREQLERWLWSDEMEHDLFDVPPGPLTERGLRWEIFQASNYIFQQGNGNSAAAIEDPYSTDIPDAEIRLMTDYATDLGNWHHVWIALRHRAPLTENGHITQKGDRITPDLVRRLLQDRWADVVTYFERQMKISPGDRQSLRGRWERVVQLQTDHDRQGIPRMFDRRLAPVAMEILERQLLHPEWIVYNKRILLSIIEVSPERRAQILDAVLSPSREAVVAKVEAGNWDPELLRLYDYVYDIVPDVERPSTTGGPTAPATPAAPIARPISDGSGSGAAMIYFAGDGRSEGVEGIPDPIERKNLLGGKGLSIHDMMVAGLPVPPAFTMTTQVGMEYLKSGRYPPGLREAVAGNLRRIEEVMERQSGIARRFGDPKHPLLVSVRSGARDSMPGMMDTVLDLGLTDVTVEGLAELTGDRRVAFDSYRRFMEGYGHIVLGIEKERFDTLRQSLRERRGVAQDNELDIAALEQELLPQHKTLVQEAVGRAFPQDVNDQLWGAIEAVFKSWNSKRAKEYREIQRRKGIEISEDWGTAVNVQAMVFGNMGDDSGTGVYFTRDRSTGERVPFGDFSVNAQGEDVVSGAYATHPIRTLEQTMPALYDPLIRAGQYLEQETHQDMVDIEFTIERGRLYLLQNRVGKRTPLAAVKIAVDMAKEGVISREAAIRRVTPQQVIDSIVSKVDPEAAKAATLLTTGAASTLGAASGKIAFSQEKVLALKAKGERVILVRPETDPNLVKGIVAADGTLTSRGGSASHAIIVGAAENKVVVAGAEQVQVDEGAGVMRIGERVLREATIRTDESGNEVVEGDEITIDADPASRAVYLGSLPLIPGQLIPELRELLAWADEIATMKVWANADTPAQARQVRDYGAQGIGLVRTEHMFFAPERMPIMQRMIMAGDDVAARRAALDELEPFQQQDFEEIFAAMDGLPTVIRLLDPPLHEFLPEYTKLALEVQKLELQAAADPGSVDPALLAEKKATFEVVERLKEVNPMLALRGARMGILYPDITAMQVRAIVRAAATVTKEQGTKTIPKIMIPLINRRSKFDDQAQLIRRVANDVLQAEGTSAQLVPYRVGTMIELPAAAFNAKEIAEGPTGAEFFSFGTNDLTQTTFGYSRDDVERKFLGEFLRRGLMETNPFVVLQPEVGQIVGIGVERGRASKPELEIGICGEHARDPGSVEMFHRLGLDYVSPSSVGVLSARLAAAQAQLKSPRAPRPSKGASRVTPATTQETPPPRIPSGGAPTPAERATWAVLRVAALGRPVVNPTGRWEDSWLDPDIEQILREEGLNRSLDGDRAAIEAAWADWEEKQHGERTGDSDDVAQQLRLRAAAPGLTEQELVAVGHRHGIGIRVQRAPQAFIQTSFDAIARRVDLIGPPEVPLEQLLETFLTQVVRNRAREFGISPAGITEMENLIHKSPLTHAPSERGRAGGDLTVSALKAMVPGTEVLVDTFVHLAALPAFVESALSLAHTVQVTGGSVVVQVLPSGGWRLRVIPRDGSALGVRVSALRAQADLLGLTTTLRPGHGVIDQRGVPATTVELPPAPQDLLAAMRARGVEPAVLIVSQPQPPLTVTLTVARQMSVQGALDDTAGLLPLDVVHKEGEAGRWVLASGVGASLARLMRTDAPAEPLASLGADIQLSPGDQLSISVDEGVQRLLAKGVLLEDAHRLAGLAPPVPAASTVPGTLSPSTVHNLTVVVPPEGGTLLAVLQRADHVPDGLIPAIRDGTVLARMGDTAITLGESALGGARVTFQWKMRGGAGDAAEEAARRNSPFMVLVIGGATFRQKVGRSLRGYYFGPVDTRDQRPRRDIEIIDVAANHFADQVAQFSGKRIDAVVVQDDMPPRLHDWLQAQTEPPLIVPVASGGLSSSLFSTIDAHKAQRLAGRPNIAGGSSPAPSAMPLPDAVPVSIFGRGFGYDIRGQASDAPELGPRNRVTLTLQGAELIGKALGSRHAPRSRVLVTGDQRESTPALREALIVGLRSVGMNVDTTSEFVPTGATSRKALADEYDLAIQISGSHNPWYANGFKITEKQNTDSRPDPQGIPSALFGPGLLEVLETIRTQSWRQGAPEGSLTTINGVVDEYINALDTILPPLLPHRVVVDSGNGVGGRAMVELLRRRGVAVVDLFSEPHPRFPNHPADPSKDDVSAPYAQSGVRYASEKIRELNTALPPGEVAYVGIVLDGDGDRSAFLDEQGRPIAPERVLVALYHRFILENRAAIAKLRAAGHTIQLALDVRASGVVKELLTQYHGVEGVFIPAGYPSHRKFVRQQIAKIREVAAAHGLAEDADIQHLIDSYTSAEASGHYFYATDPTHPDIKIDDGLYAAVLGLHLLDTAAQFEAKAAGSIRLPQQERYTLSELFDAIPKLPVTTDIRDPVDEDAKFAIVAEAKAAAIARYRDALKPTEGLHEVDGLKVQGPEDGVIEVDGVRVQLQDGSWFLIRASNTSPMLTYKVEAQTQARLVELMQEVLVGLLEPFESRGLSTQGFRTELERQRPAGGRAGAAEPRDFDGADELSGPPAEVPPRGAPTAEEAAARKMAEQVFKSWRRSYDVPPPPDTQGMSESLKMVREQRVRPAYQEEVRPRIMQGQHVLMSAHGNSLRGLSMDLFDLTSEDVQDFTFPLATPVIVRFDTDGKIMRVEIIQAGETSRDQKNVDALKALLTNRQVPFFIVKVLESGEMRREGVFPKPGAVPGGDLILVRHGETQSSDTQPGGGFFAGWTDVALTPQGEQEARASGKALARWLGADYPIHVEFTSDLRRAKETLRAVLAGLERPSILTVEEPRFKERHYGALQGKARGAFMMELTGYIERLWREEPSLANADARTIAQRLSERWQELANPSAPPTPVSAEGAATQISLRPAAETPAIAYLDYEKINDSREKETIRARIHLADGTVGNWFAVPAGKSTGKGEAPVVTVDQAIANLGQAMNAIQAAGLKVGQQAEIDRLLKEHLAEWGGNTTLAVSMAVAQAAAKHRGIESALSAAVPANQREGKRRVIQEFFNTFSLAEITPEAFDGVLEEAVAALASQGIARAAALAAIEQAQLASYIATERPDAISDSTEPILFYMNVLNGGLHVPISKEFALELQEFMGVPKARTYDEALAMGLRVRAALVRLIEEEIAKPKTERHISEYKIGDEGGIAPAWPQKQGRNLRAIDLLVEAIRRAGFEPGRGLGQVAIALDPAATSFSQIEQKRPDRYDFEGEVNGPTEMVDFYQNVLERVPNNGLISIEDGLSEDDWDGTVALTTATGSRIAIIGDDLFVTQADRLQKGIRMGAGNAILIKLNQNGTLSGTLDAVETAKRAGWRSVWSHRSGETMDSAIGDLAVATRAFALKAGDPTQDVRRVKYNRVIVLDRLRAAVAAVEVPKTTVPEFRTIETLPSGQSVFLKTNWDVGNTEGEWDTTKVRQTLPTLRASLQKFDEVYVNTHVGRPGGAVKSSLSVAPIADEVRTMLQEQGIDAVVVVLPQNPQEIPAAIWSAQADHSGKKLVFIMENVRFYPEEKSADAWVRRRFGEWLKYVTGASAYILEAFESIQNEQDASMEMVELFAPTQRAAGFSFQEEANKIIDFEARAGHPRLYIFGGSKFDKLVHLRDLLAGTNAISGDTIAIVGALAYPVLQEAGHTIGDSLMPTEQEWEDYKLREVIADIQRLSQEKGITLITPVDHIATFSDHPPMGFPTVDIPDWAGVTDIGPYTLDKIIAAIQRILASGQGGIVINGGAGRFEFSETRRATRDILFAAEAAAEAGIPVFLVGGDMYRATTMIEEEDLHHHSLSPKLMRTTAGGAAFAGLARGLTTLKPVRAVLSDVQSQAEQQNQSRDLGTPSGGGGAIAGGAGGTVESFLSSTKLRALALPTIKGSKPIVHVVVGNVSADLDSSVSAVAYAHYTSITQPFEGEGEGKRQVVYLPVINIPRAELRLKAEVVAWLKQFDIPEDALLFRDTLDNVQTLRDQGFDVKFTLVDHDTLAPGQEQFQPLVVDVIDHHPVSAVAERDRVGSNATLIAERLLPVLGHLPEADRKELAHFLLGPIVLDTVDLKAKGHVTDRDLHAAQQLLVMTDLASTTPIFEALEDAKFHAWKERSLDDILWADPKSYQAGKVSYDFLSIQGPLLHDLLASPRGKSGRSISDRKATYAMLVERLQQALKDHKRDLLFGIMRAKTGPGTYAVNLFVLAEDEARLQGLETYLQRIPSLQSNRIPNEQIAGSAQPARFMAFTLNPDVTRKILEQPLKDFFTTAVEGSTTGGLTWEDVTLHKLSPIDFGPNWFRTVVTERQERQTISIDVGSEDGEFTINVSRSPTATPEDVIRAIIVDPFVPGAIRDGYEQLLNRSGAASTSPPARAASAPGDVGIKPPGIALRESERKFSERKFVEAFTEIVAQLRTHEAKADGASVTFDRVHVPRTLLETSTPLGSASRDTPYGGRIRLVGPRNGSLKEELEKLVVQRPLFDFPGAFDNTGGGAATLRPRPALFEALEQAVWRTPSRPLAGGAPTAEEEAARQAAAADPLNETGRAWLDMRGVKQVRALQIQDPEQARVAEQGAWIPYSEQVNSKAVSPELATRHADVDHPVWVVIDASVLEAPDARIALDRELDQLAFVMDGSRGAIHYRVVHDEDLSRLPGVLRQQLEQEGLTPTQVANSRIGVMIGPAAWGEKLIQAVGSQPAGPFGEQEIRRFMFEPPTTVKDPTVTWAGSLIVAAFEGLAVSPDQFRQVVASKLDDLREKGGLFFTPPQDVAAEIADDVYEHRTLTREAAELSGEV